MAKFYVNMFYDESIRKELGLPYKQDLIGLFKQCKTEGRGSFCGYYGAEYYLNTELYAYYVADSKSGYTPEERISDVEICIPTLKYREMLIGSHMWTQVIEAETVSEALEAFKNAKWRSWRLDTDSEAYDLHYIGKIRCEGKSDAAN